MFPNSHRFFRLSKISRNALFLTGSLIMLHSGAYAQQNSSPATGSSPAPTATAPKTATPPAGTQATTAPAPATPPTLEKYDAATLIKTVDGKTITMGDLLLSFGGLPPQIKAMEDRALFEGLSSQLTDEIILSELARKASLQNTPKFKMMMAAQERALLAEMQMRSLIDPKLTPETIKARYDLEISKLPKTEEIKARHILVETENQAKELIAQLDKGADFSKLAKENTRDPSGKENGGDLGWFTHEAMVPEFSEVAFKLNKGQRSAPVKSSFGWHIILVDDKRIQPPPSFDEVSQQLRQRMVAELAEAELAKLRSTAKIDSAPVLPPFKAIREENLLPK